MMRQMFAKPNTQLSRWYDSVSILIMLRKLLYKMSKNTDTPKYTVTYFMLVEM
jgi:hypothetical protein